MNIIVTHICLSVGYQLYKTTNGHICMKTLSHVGLGQTRIPLTFVGDPDQDLDTAIFQSIRLLRLQESRGTAAGDSTSTAAGTC